MKNLDNFSKRILSIAISFSLVLLTSSLFVHSINSLSAKALNPTSAIPPVIASENYCPLGISNGFVYYFYMSGSSIEFSKVNVAVAKDFSENYK